MKQPVRCTKGMGVAPNRYPPLPPAAESSSSGSSSRLTDWVIERSKTFFIRSAPSRVLLLLDAAAEVKCHQREKQLACRRLLSHSIPRGDNAITCRALRFTGRALELHLLEYGSTLQNIVPLCTQNIVKIVYNRPTMSFGLTYTIFQVRYVLYQRSELPTM